MSPTATAQRSPLPHEEPVMYFEAFKPRSTLVVDENPVTRARFPFVDVHAHFFGAADMSDDQLEKLVGEMDAMNMAALVNLSGRSGQALRNSISTMEGYAPERFVTFANVDFRGIDDPGWTEASVTQLEADIRNGARGLKIYKNLGMEVRDSKGNRVRVDDERIGPIWDLCGRLGVPVLIHTADPAPFWLPRDENNERWFELKERPNRIRPSDQYPSWETIIGEQHNIFRRHSQTTFISAHMGWLGNDLARLSDLLDELPNVYVEMGAVLAELGRQPRTAKAFLERHKDRVLFGKDSYAPSEYHVYFRVLETEDEYFDYYRQRHAHWKMYGLGLSDDALQHIYYKNALRIIPGLDASLFE
ncbi:MAG: amidohydrolase family protein [Rhodothermales bacterium]|nr:amidohydrolase family protein [Rhodothermales bacterium]